MFFQIKYDDDDDNDDDDLSADRLADTSNERIAQFCVLADNTCIVLIRK